MDNKSDSMDVADPVSAAATILLRSVGQPIIDATKRNERVIKLLQTLKLDAATPPGDIMSVYAYALVEWGVGQPAPYIVLMRDEHVRAAAFKAVDDSSAKPLMREIELAVDRNRETGEFGHLDSGVAGAAVRFLEILNARIDRTRSAYQVRQEAHLKRIENAIEKLAPEAQPHVRQEFSTTRISPLQDLSNSLTAWFSALRYRVVDIVLPTSSARAWAIEVPAMHARLLRVVVYAVGTELAPAHIRSLQRLVDDRAANEGWAVAPGRISAMARAVARESTGDFYCYTLDDLIDQTADFGAYFEWLSNEVKRLKIDSRFVELSCAKPEIDWAASTSAGIDAMRSIYPWDEGGLTKYVRSWISDPSIEHLSILGEFGTGKSWFALHLAWLLSQEWQHASKTGNRRPRLPVLISLRDYSKSADVESMISDFLFRKHEILGGGGYRVFEELNRQGRLLLIFDGFDEMAARMDRDTMVRCFWELTRVISPASKVLLTSRAEFFPSLEAAAELLKSGTPLTPTAPGGGTAVQFEIVEVEPLDNRQIRHLLATRTSPEEATAILSRDDIADLLRRPVMADLVLEALPDLIDSDQDVSSAQVYVAAVVRKLDRDEAAGRTFTSRADKIHFLSEISWSMYERGTLSLNYRDFPASLREIFGDTVRAQVDLDHWQYDMRNQAMFTRDARGNYAASHKSMLEFFVAFKFAGELGLLEGPYRDAIVGRDSGNGLALTWSEYFARRHAESISELKQLKQEPLQILAKSFGSWELDFTVLRFLTDMLAIAPAAESQLLSIIAQTRDFAADKVNSVGGNALSLWWSTIQSRVNDYSRMIEQLREVDFSGTNLAGANANHDIVVLKDLAELQLTGCDLSQVDLQWSSVKNANLRGAKLNPTIAISGPMQWGALPIGDESVIALVGTGTVLWSDGLSGPRNNLELPRGDRIRELFACDESFMIATAKRWTGAISLESFDAVFEWPARAIGAGRLGNESVVFFWNRIDGRVVVDVCSLQGDLLDRIPAPSGLEKVQIAASGKFFGLVPREATIEIIEFDFGSRTWKSVDRISLSASDLESYGQAYNLLDTVAIVAPIGEFELRNHLLVRGGWQMVEARRLGDSSETIWRRSLGHGASYVAVRLNQESVVVVQGSGELSELSVSDGAELGSASTNTMLEGVEISLDCGLSPELIAFIAASGGVVHE